MLEEIPVANFGTQEEAAPKRKLEKICDDLVIAFDERLKTPTLFEAIFEPFDSYSKWFNPAKFSEVGQIELLRNKFKKILLELEGFRSEQYSENFEQITHGYNLFWIIVMIRTAETKKMGKNCYWINRSGKNSTILTILSISLLSFRLKVTLSRSGLYGVEFHQLSRDNLGTGSFDDISYIDVEKSQFFKSLQKFHGMPD